MQDSSCYRRLKQFIAAANATEAGIAGSAQQEWIAIKSLRQLQSGFDDIHLQTSQLTSKAPAKPATAAVVNSTGQATGTVVNTTA